MSNHCIVYLKPIKKLLKLISEFSKMLNIRSIYKTQLYFYMLSCVRLKNLKIIPLTRASKKHKVLKINLLEYAFLK